MSVVRSASEDLDDAVAIDAGSGHTCAVRSGGSVVCWGANEEGQLGDGTLTDRRTPVRVDGLDDAVAVTAGCGLLVCPASGPDRRLLG